MSLLSRCRTTFRLTFNVRRAIGFVWRSARGWTLANVALLTVQGLLPIVSLYLLRIMVDVVVAGAGEAFGATGTGAQSYSGAQPYFQAEVVPVLLAVATVALATALARVVGGVVNKEQTRRVVDYMHDVLQRKAVEVDLAYYENAAYHDTLHRAQEEAVYRPGVVVNALTAVLQNAISLAGVAWLLLMFQWPVLAILVVAMIPALIVRLVFSEREYLRERSYTNRERSAAYYHWMLVGREMAKEVRVFGLGATFIERFRAIRAELRRIRLELDIRGAGFLSVAQTASTALVFVAYFWVARDAVLGLITVGAFVMFYQAFQKGQMFLQAGLEGVARLYENNLFLTNLYEFLDIPNTRVAPAAPSIPLHNGSGSAQIEFEDVWFRYPDCDDEVLQGVNLRIDRGTTAALVGLNGAGKTTVVKLLCRLYDVDQGRILLDGVDLRDMEPEMVRRKVGVIFQDYARYDLSARDNIWLGNVERENRAELVEEAAGQAGADSLIRELPGGYETVLGKLFDTGHELSVGEWQKVALARAFFRNTEVVVLDEPTSSMDPKAEHELFARFHDILNGRTALLISHRMSTVRMADTIFVMENGRIIEHGPHHHLMTVGGVYADLFDTQARNYLPIDGGNGRGVSL